MYSQILRRAVCAAALAAGLGVTAGAQQQGPKPPTSPPQSEQQATKPVNAPATQDAKPPAGQQPPRSDVGIGQADPQKPTFHVRVDLVTTDVIVRDGRGQFVADLDKKDFDVFEDGVKQDIVSMDLIHGGRVNNILSVAPAPAQEGIILPQTRPASDVAGRIFIFFIDDLHLQFSNTARVRRLLQDIGKTLLHDGDMFAIQTTGPSSVAEDLTYDKKRFTNAITRISGSELKPSEIINGPESQDGPTEVRYRAHVAFSTVNDLLQTLDQVKNRRKALVYVSDGYDFNPFEDARNGIDPSGTGAFLTRDNGTASANANANSQAGQAAAQQTGDQDPWSVMGKEFADADLVRELADLTRTANRANVTMYTIDPRGLVGMSDMDEQVDPTEWEDYIHKSQDSLRVLAEQTGGVAVINQNDFTKSLQRIDQETSDYYVLGFYSSNPDPTKRQRTIAVKVTRPGVDVWSRKGYQLKRQPKGS